jgi:hypothetical protein
MTLERPGPELALELALALALALERERPGPPPSERPAGMERRRVEERQTSRS